MRARASCSSSATSRTSSRPYETQGQYHGTSAALEFAVQALRVKHIVVLGHARCGGIRAFADDAAPLSPGDFIGRWMDLIAPAARRLGAADGDREDYLTRLELATVEHGLAQPHDLPLRAASSSSAASSTCTAPISASRPVRSSCATRQPESSPRPWQSCRGALAANPSPKRARGRGEGPGRRHSGRCRLRRRGNGRAKPAYDFSAALC